MFKNNIVIQSHKLNLGFRQWRDINYPPGFTNTNCIIIPQYRDTNPELTVIVKFDLAQTKFSCYNTNQGDSGHTINLIFFKNITI